MPFPPEATLRKPVDFKQGPKETGITKPAFVSDLLSFHGATFFGLGQMHNLAGVGKQAWKILTGKYNAKGSNGKRLPPLLKPLQQKQISVRMVLSRKYILSSFAGDCGDIVSSMGYYRCVDWIHFVRYLLPTIIADYLSSDKDKCALKAISAVFNLACSYTITKIDTAKAIDDNLKVWLDWLNDESSGISKTVFSINMHYLNHIPFMLETMGPMHSYSEYNMERAMREYKYGIRSTRNPSANADNLLLDFAAERMRRRRSVGKDDQKDNTAALEGDEEDYEIWSPGKTVTVGDITLDQSSRFKQCLNTFFTTWIGGFDSVRTGVHDSDIIHVGSRLWPVVFWSKCPWLL